MQNSKCAFSLIELLFALVAISCIIAIMAPTITVKLKTNAIAVGTEQAKISEDCSARFGADCSVCYMDICIVCSKACLEGETLNKATCSCSSCSQIDANCTVCKDGKCTKCAEGYGLTAGTCLKCAEGYYGDGTKECLPCPAGNYQDSEGSGSCIPCPEGQYQAETGKNSCITCPGGQYQTQTGQTSCRTCEVDFACPGGAQRNQCAINQGADAGSAVCSACSANCDDCQVPSICLACASGYYLSNNVCLSCEAGYTCDGTATPSACGAGYYSSAGSATCLACSAGYYSSAGSASCLACSAGYYSSAGSSTCLACSAGYYSSAGSSTCLACSDKTTNCAACNSSTGVCTGCVDGYTLGANNECEKITPCTNANCGQFAMCIETSETTAICMTKYNLGDHSALPPGANITLVQAGSGTVCTAESCCWNGNTAGSCDAENGGYSGCTRTLCDWSAANLGCQALTYMGKTWRLPYIHELDRAFSGYSVGLGINGLMLCDLEVGKSSAHCLNSAKCPSGKGGTATCYPSYVWSSQPYSPGYHYAMLTNGVSILGPSGLPALSALSVRCVSDVVMEE